MIKSTRTKVSDIMSRQVLVAHPRHEFLPLCRLFLLMNIHHLPVVDEQGKLIGILSANDVLKALSFKLPQLKKADEENLNKEFPVLDLMTPLPLETVSPDDSISAATRIFVSRNISCLPVLAGEEVVGIITHRDIIKFLGNEEWADD